MLKTLTVWNFALLEHVEINFDAGLNILTGETGAGKSILIDALGAVLGHRLSSDVIRTGCDWLRVEAIFDITGEKRLHDLLAEQAIDDEDDSLIITRQITTKGKNVILVNGCHVTAGTLRAIGEFLVDIHGQHENLALVRTENQFALLDGSDAELPKLLSSYRVSFRAWKDAAAELAEKKESAGVS
ncbi:MAG: AAA family ATPase, partial [Schwartzia sp.]|nr:AAA family ATPase [Schwartzia sp. (in: firmicutes)]